VLKPVRSARGGAWMNRALTAPKITYKNSRNKDGFFGSLLNLTSLTCALTAGDAAQGK